MSLLMRSLCCVLVAFLAADALQDFTYECFQVSETCDEFSRCCNSKSCPPSIFLLTRCAHVSSQIQKDHQSYCKCSATQPSYESAPSSNPYPSYTYECLKNAYTCEDFERCCAKKTCRGGVTKRYDCGYNPVDRSIKRDKAQCYCVRPDGAEDSMVGASSGPPALSLSLLAAFLFIKLFV